MQPWMHAYRSGGDAVAAIELQDVRDEPLEPPGVVVDDAREAHRVVIRLLLGEELGSVADGGEWIADLVRDVGGQAAERSQLELLGLLARARRVFHEEH